MSAGNTFKKFDYTNVDRVVTEIENEIKNAKSSINTCDENMAPIGTKEDVMTGQKADEIKKNWVKSKEGFEAFVNDFKKLINQKYEEAGSAHHKFEND